jgi:biotin transport system substrate-specific component
VQGLARAPTLIEAAFPSTRTLEVLGWRVSVSALRDIALILGFAALVAVCGRIRFYLPDNDFPGSVNPIPITPQTFAVLLTGAALGSWRGAASLLVFYFVGMAGLPVFQGGHSGWSYVSGSPSAGFLIGFIAASYLTGFLAERGWNRGTALWALLAGNVVLYIPGLLWLVAKSPAVSWENVLSKGLYPFIPGDLLKLMMVGIVLPSAWALINLRSDKSRLPSTPSGRDRR